MVLEFRLLGPVEVRRDGLALELGSAKSRALLAFLLLSPNRPVSTERLIEALWGGAPLQSARQALQNRVSAVRRALGLDQGALVTRERGYLVRVDPEAIDAHRFVGLADRGRAALAAGDPVPAAVLLRQALALWRGPAVADGFDAGAPWPAVGWLEERRLAAIEDRIEADLARGQHRELAGELRALIATHPLRERLRGQLMLALYRSGRQAEALAAYRDGRAAFVAELGTEPGVELRRLEQAILAQDSSLELARAGETTAPDGPDRTRGPATTSPGSERKLVTALLADIDEPAGPGGEPGRPVPLLVVATARPELLERRPGLGAEEALLRLGPLPTATPPGCSSCCSPVRASTGRSMKLAPRERAAATAAAASPAGQSAPTCSTGLAAAPCSPRSTRACCATAARPPGRPRRPCRSACTRSSPPGWTRCRRRRSRCCRTPPCSAR